MTNDTLRIAPDRVRQLLLQWPAFDERRYLQGELGRAETSFAEFFNGAIGYPNLWNNTLKPGNLAGTSIEAYRAMNLSNIDISAVLGVVPLNHFMLSLLKNGQTFASNEPQRFDVSKCQGVSFRNVDSIYLYAPYVEFNGCVFYDSKFKFPDFYQAVFRACTIDHCFMDQGFWNDDGAGQTRKDWSQVIIRKSNFQSANFPRIRWLSSVIEDSNFFGSDFRQFDNSTDAVTPTMFRNQFDSCLMSIRTGLVGKIEDCDFQNSQFSGPDVFSGYIRRNNFSSCTFQAATFQYRVDYNSFRNSWFYVMPTIGDQCSFYGCDFTGSNLDTYFTKEEFRAAVPYLDDSTIWVDGTPFI